MEKIHTVADLVQQLSELPQGAPVLLTVIKYPDEFKLKNKNGEISWDESDDVEVLPWEGELYLKDNLVHLVVELTDYTEERREYIK